MTAKDGKFDYMRKGVKMVSSASQTAYGCNIELKLNDSGDFHPTIDLY